MVQDSHYITKYSAKIQCLKFSTQSKNKKTLRLVQFDLKSLENIYFYWFRWENIHVWRRAETFFLEKGANRIENKGQSDKMWLLAEGVQLKMKQKPTPPYGCAYYYLLLFTLWH